MAEDGLGNGFEVGLFASFAPSWTADHLLVGAGAGARYRATLTRESGIEAYGSEADWLQTLDGHDVTLAEGLTEAMVRFAARYEYARTVEDVLARRYRLLFLDARMAGRVARSEEHTSELQSLMRTS